MRNLFKMFRKSPKSVFLITGMFFLVLQGCKNDSPQNKPTIEPDKITEITVTVKKDSHVTKAVPSFRVNKGSTLGATVLKNKLALEFAQDYEFSKICLNDDKGKEITDTAKHKFDENTIIYVVSKEKLKTGSVTLTKITVAGQEKTGTDITNEMTFNETDKGAVTVNVELSDAVAKVAFANGQLQNSRKFKWVLKTGENKLQISVGKDVSDLTTYMVILSTTCQPLHVIYTLNGVSMGAIPNQFKQKVEDGENPTFDALGSYLHIILKIVGEVEKIEINGTSIPKTQDSGWYIAKHSIPISTEPTQIEIIASPTDATLETTTAKTLRFKAKGSGNKDKIKPVLEISGNKKFSSQFMQDLVGQTPPLHKVWKSPAKIKVSISEYEKEFLCKKITINGDNLTLTKDVTTYSGTQDIDVDVNSPTAITIVFETVDENITDSITWKFKVQGGGDKLAPEGVRIIEINGKGNAQDPLPPSLTEHLKDKSNPLYLFDGDKAKVVVGTNTQNLIDKIDFKMDGTSQSKITVDNSKYPYKAEYTFEILDSNAHDIEIVIEPKDTESYGNLTFKFQLKKSGKKPTIPRGKMGIFTLKGKQVFYLPKALTEHLTDGSEPLHIIDGKHASISVGTQDKTTSQKVDKVKFSVGQAVAIEVPLAEVPTYFGGSEYIASTILSLPDKTNEHLIKIEFVPKNLNEYSSLIYTFKLKSNGNAEELPLVCGVDGKPTNNGESVTVKGEAATILVQAKADILSKVEIGIEGSEEDARIIHLSDVNTWNAQKMVLVIGSDGVVEEKTVVIKATAKDSEAYKNAVYKYKIKGTKVASNNTEFVTNAKGPLLFSDVKYASGLESDEIYAYGTVSVSLEAHTVSPRAKVKWQIVDLNEKPFENSTVQTMTQDSKGLPIHEAKNIQLFTDKPTMIKAWVEAEDGTVGTGDKGICRRSYNPIGLKWSYDKHNKGAEFDKWAYNLIELERDQIQNNKIYLAFAVWKEEFGYKVTNEGKQSWQSDFVYTPIDIFKEQKQWYKTEINVESLTVATNPAGELIAILPVQRKVANGSYLPAITYKVKIKLK